jgi:hypothetical protein
MEAASKEVENMKKMLQREREKNRLKSERIDSFMEDLEML